MRDVYTEAKKVGSQEGFFETESGWVVRLLVDADWEPGIESEAIGTWCLQLFATDGSGFWMRGGLRGLRELSEAIEHLSHMCAARGLDDTDMGAITDAVLDLHFELGRTSG